MRYLILGGLGFIGSNLAHRLLDNEENTVTIIDPASNWEFDRIDMNDYLRLWILNERIQNVNMDYMLERHDIVYHFASSVGVSEIDNNPQAALFNNIEMMNILIPVFERHQKKVIFASTSEIYGEGPFHEQANASIGPPDTLRWGYAASKLITEFMIQASTFPFLIVRFFNVTGPGQEKMVLPTFINAAVNDEDIIVHGNGAQIRSFCHINDALNALELIEDFDNETFNIGNDEQPISMADLAFRVKVRLGSNSDINLVRYEDVFSDHHGEIFNRVPVLDKIKELGYVPIYGLNEIINDMEINL